jgi:hypothetical protein
LDWKSFTVAIVGALIWPITVLVVLLILRRPITTLLETTRRFKASGFGSDIDVDFGAQAEGLVESGVRLVAEHVDGAADGAGEGGDPLQGNLLPDLEDRFKDLSSIVYIAPQGTILEAWTIIEQELISLAEQHGTEQPGQHRSMRRMINDMTDASILHKSEAILLDELRFLRNQAAHPNTKNELSPESALYYLEASNLALALLRSH